MLARDKRFAGFKELRSKEERMKGKEQSLMDNAKSDYSFVSEQVSKVGKKILEI